MRKKINPRQIKTGLIYGPIQPPQMKFMSKEEKESYLDELDRKDQGYCETLRDLFMSMDIIKTIKTEKKEG